MAQWIKDPVSLLWLGSLLWHGSDLWPRNFCMPWAQPETKKKNKTKTKKPNKQSIPHGVAVASMELSWENLHPLISVSK